MYTRNLEGEILRFLGASLAAGAAVLALTLLRLSDDADMVARIATFYGVTLFLFASLRRVRMTDVLFLVSLLAVGGEIARTSSDPLPLVWSLAGILLAAAPVWIARPRETPRRRASDREPTPSRAAVVNLQAWIVEAAS